MRRLPLLCSFPALCLWALCSGGWAADPPPGPTQHLEIAVWYDGPSRSLEPVSAIAWIFQQHHKNVVVNLRRHATVTAYPLLTRWTTIDPGNAPDLMVISSSWLPQFKDSLVALDAVAAGPAARKFPPAALELFTLDGHLRAVPRSLAARVLVVRSDLLAKKKLAPPTTWEEVQTVAAALHDPPRCYGLGLPAREDGGGAVLLQEMLWGVGEALLGPTGGIELTAPAKVAALEGYLRLAQVAQPENLTWTQSELESLFIAGRLGMLVTDTWAARSWQGAPDLPEYQVLPLPAGTQPVAHLLGDGLAVFGQSAKRDLAVEFAQMVLLAQAQRKLMEWGGLPVHQDLRADTAKDPLLGGVLATVPEARIVPPFQPPALAKALDYALYLALSGRATPAAALAAADAALRGQAAPPTTPGAPAGVG